MDSQPQADTGVGRDATDAEAHDQAVDVYRATTARLNAYARLIGAARMSDLAGPLADCLDDVAEAVRRIARDDGRH